MTGAAWMRNAEGVPQFVSEYGVAGAPVRQHNVAIRTASGHRPTRLLGRPTHRSHVVIYKKHLDAGSRPQGRYGIAFSNGAACSLQRRIDRDRAEVVEGDSELAPDGIGFIESSRPGSAGW